METKELAKLCALGIKSENLEKLKDTAKGKLIAIKVEGQTIWCQEKYTLIIETGK